MCGYACSRVSLIILSLTFLVIGGGLLGSCVYAQIYKLIYEKHFLTRYYEDAVSEDLKGRIENYFLIVTCVGIGVGFILFVTGIAGLVGSCKNFQTTTRYGVQRSSLGGFVFLLMIVMFAMGFSAACLLYIGADGQEMNDMEPTSGTTTTRRPDFKVKWKILDLQQTANQVFNDITEFYQKNYPDESKDEAEGFIIKVLFLSGGVTGALALIMVLWLIVACCVSCGPIPDVDDYLYVSPERRKYDDWITN